MVDDCSEIYMNAKAVALFMSGRTETGRLYRTSLLKQV